MYVLPGEQLSDQRLLAILGLGGLGRRPELADPAARIVHDRVSLRDDVPPRPPFSLRLGYRIARRARGVVPLALAVAVIQWLARRHLTGRHLTGRNSRPDLASVAEIGRMVHGVELAVGIEECYPRALLTCYLCLRGGRACDLTVGALSPTQMMHIWCATDGLLPYEALPEHFMYQPLVTLRAA